MDKRILTMVTFLGVMIVMATARMTNFVQAAESRPPDSSRIIKFFDTQTDTAAGRGGEVQRLELADYSRPDMIGYIYEGKFELVPATGLDNIRYYAQGVGDLAARCPTLNLDAAKHEIIPYLFSGISDLVRRLQTGKLSQSEVLQAAWLAILGLNRHWSCQYDPGIDSLDQAQARCNAAARDSSELGVLPSLDAAQDVTLFLGRYGCKSEQARHLARQLIAFGRVAHTRQHFTKRMPSPTSPRGKAYASIFENCTRGSIDNADSAWCGCYVRTLHAINPPGHVLEGLARNPFVDGSTYMSWITRNVPGGNALYDCEDTLRGKLDWRERRAPRATACLISEAPAGKSAKECYYRAAWGEFTMTHGQCIKEITSRRWGYREVDCAAQGAIAVPSVGPREWQDGAFTYIDYENEVASDFVLPVPADARSKHPLQIRLLKRNTPGLLKSVSLTVMTGAHLMMAGMPMNLMSMSGQEIAAIDKEGALLLECTYKAQKGVRTKTYWFERVPKHIQGGHVNPEIQPYLAKINGAATKCPNQF